MRFLSYVVFLFCPFLPLASQAQEAVFKTPVKANTPGTNATLEQPPLRLTPDRSELVHLSEPAKSVIVGNPQHLSVSLDSPELLILAPGAPGTTYFTVLGENGKILMQRHVMVGAPKSNYIRVRNMCPAEQEGCVPTAIYYCPDKDICSEIGMPVEGDNNNTENNPAESLTNAADIVSAANEGEAPVITEGAE